jgi:hypothetical protein
MPELFLEQQTGEGLHSGGDSASEDETGKIKEIVLSLVHDK